MPLRRRQELEERRHVEVGRIHLEIVTPDVVSRRREVRRRVRLAAGIVGVALDVAVAVAEPRRAAGLLDDPARQIEAPAAVLLALATLRIGRGRGVRLWPEPSHGE